MIQSLGNDRRNTLGAVLYFTLLKFLWLERRVLNTWGNTEQSVKTCTATSVLFFHSQVLVRQLLPIFTVTTQVNEKMLQVGLGCSTFLTSHSLEVNILNNPLVNKLRVRHSLKNVRTNSRFKILPVVGWRILGVFQAKHLSNSLANACCCNAKANIPFTQFSPCLFIG